MVCVVKTDSIEISAYTPVLLKQSLPFPGFDILTLPYMIPVSKEKNTIPFACQGMQVVCTADGSSQLRRASPEAYVQPKCIIF
jgi:hypothetical protein